MGRDAQVPGAGIGRQKPRDGGRGAPGAGALIEAVGDGPRAEGIAGQGVGERGIELAGVVLVEEPEQAAPPIPGNGLRARAERCPGPSPDRSHPVVSPSIPKRSVCGLEHRRAEGGRPGR